ncbi:hypothetical protein [Litoribacillus peritrichatus]|uniref:Uncharacterized protein n=1 Tax=Litoribacillus peritrichatus TaxID=718191 RepID=A0ABP7MEH5_9GAMM
MNMKANLAANNGFSIVGWSEWKPVTSEVKAVFDRATIGLAGVQYLPLEFATQIVDGLHYRFICEASLVIPKPQPFVVMIELYEPLGDGQPVVTGIERMG